MEFARTSATSSWFRDFFKKRKRSEDEDEQENPEKLLVKTRKLFTCVFNRNQRDFSPPPKGFPLALAQSAVHKLFDDKEHVGTFVFVAEHIGVCAFHCIVKRSSLRQDTLRVNGCALLHIISYPFYDITFYYCPNQAHPYLSLDSSNAIIQGTEVVMASYPDLYGSWTCEKEEADLYYGRVCRSQWVPDSPMIAAQYLSFPGSSGGAVMSLEGKLIGIHMESLHYEASYKGKLNATEFRMQSDLMSKHVSEDTSIRYPNLTWRQGRRVNAEVNRLHKEDVETLARYSAVNIQHKASMALYLPVVHIRLKLENAKKIVLQEISSVLIE